MTSNLLFLYLLVVLSALPLSITLRAPIHGGQATRRSNHNIRSLAGRDCGHEKEELQQQHHWQEQLPLSPECDFSDLSAPGRHVTIVTTAALPWMTGTSINPLLRAEHLAQCGIDVCLCLPWLEPEDQHFIFRSKGQRFASPREQEKAVHLWLNETRQVDGRSGSSRSTDTVGETGEKASFAISWCKFLRAFHEARPFCSNPARYHPKLGSVFYDDRAAGAGGRRDLLAHLPPTKRDVLILEEPEHLNWYHNGPRWAHHFNFVVGIGHTNYMQYSREDPLGGGWYKAPFQRFFSGLVMRAYCDVVVDLSAALADSGCPRDLSVVCNVHGVRDEFLAIGRGKSESAAILLSKGNDEQCSSSSSSSSSSSFSSSRPQRIYFLGKKLWTKGYRELLSLVDSEVFRAAAAANAEEEEEGEEARRLLIMGSIDLYGSGPDEPAIHEEVQRINRRAMEEEEEEEEAVAGRRRRGPLLRCFPATDHGGGALDDYGVFVNAATSDVLCTATAEALAMGKNVVIARHRSNEFFYRFENCFPFDSVSETPSSSRKGAAFSSSSAAADADADADAAASSFTAQLAAAAAAPPKPLSLEEQRLLSWAAATERLIDVVKATGESATGAGATTGMAPRPSLSTSASMAYVLHTALGLGLFGEVLRASTGLERNHGELEWLPELTHRSNTSPLESIAEAFGRWGKPRSEVKNAAANNNNNNNNNKSNGAKNGKERRGGDTTWASELTAKGTVRRMPSLRQQQRQLQWGFAATPATTAAASLLLCVLGAASSSVAPQAGEEALRNTFASSSSSPSSSPRVLLTRLKDTSTSTASLRGGFFAKSYDAPHSRFSRSAFPFSSSHDQRAAPDAADFAIGSDRSDSGGGGVIEEEEALWRSPFSRPQPFDFLRHPVSSSFSPLPMQLRASDDSREFPS